MIVGNALAICAAWICALVALVVGLVLHRRDPKAKAERRRIAAIRKQRADLARAFVAKRRIP